MSKKIICLFLSLIMLLAVCLTSCTDQGAAATDPNQKDVDAQTLAMYLMCEEKVSDATAAAIEQAVNTITMNKFKTKLKLYFYTEDEYYAKLDAAFAARDEAKKNGTIMNSNKVEETDEDGNVIDNSDTYPEIAPYQVDIFYFGGKDNFDKYKGAGMLSKLDDEINTTSQILKTTIANQYLNSIKSPNRGTYAIPTCKAIGEYTYLLLNKEALEADYRRNANGTNDYSAYSSLTCDEIKDFLFSVSDPEGELADKFYPISTNLSEGEILINNLKYWGVDEDGKLSDAFSILGGYYTNNQDYLDVNAYSKIENLFENQRFLNDIKTLKEYSFKGYYEADENKEFAVGYFKGGAELAEQYGDKYELVPIECPRLDEEELYSDLFGVCSYTRSVSRSMEIITFLNTDEGFRNLLLYGVEEENYLLNVFTEKDEFGKDKPIKNQYGENIVGVEKIEREDNYVMSINKTGNTLLAYPTMDESPTLRQYQVKQNQDAKVRLELDFAVTEDVDAEKLQEIRTLSATLLEKYLACNNAAELEAFIEEARAQIAASEAVAYHLNAEEAGSLISCYNKWLKDKKIVK